MIVISGSLIWLETLMELIFNPCGEFRWNPEGPVSQIHSPHLRFGAPTIFSDLLRSAEMVKREWGVESKGELPHLFILGKTAALIPNFVEDLPSAELQPWYLCLQWRTYPWAEHSDDDDAIYLKQTTNWYNNLKYHAAFTLYLNLPTSVGQVAQMARCLASGWTDLAGCRVPEGRIFFFTPCTDWSWGPLSLL